MTGQVGAQSRMLFDTGTIDTGSIWFEFLSETITQTIPLLNSAGIRGTRSHASERNRRGNETVSGAIEFEASRILLDNLLPAALGAAEAANVFGVAETIPEFNMMIDKGVDICLVSAAKIASLVIRGVQGEIVKVTANIEAESITWGQSWPSGPVPEISKPYFFSDLGDVTIESSARSVFDFDVTIDNSPITDQFANNLTRDGLINASDRIVTNNANLPATTANSALTSSAVAGEQIQFVLTNADEASSVLTITLGRVSYNAATPTIGGKGQIVIPLSGQSRALGHAGATAPDISITNAHAA